MARFPGFEFAGPIFPAGGTQFGHDFWILRGQPILQFVQCFHRREDRCGDFNSIRFHALTLPSLFAPLKQCFRCLVAAKGMLDGKGIPPRGFPVHPPTKGQRNEVPEFIFYVAADKRLAIL